MRMRNKCRWRLRWGEADVLWCLTSLSNVEWRLSFFIYFNHYIKVFACCSFLVVFTQIRKEVRNRRGNLPSAVAEPLGLYPKFLQLTKKSSVFWGFIFILHHQQQHNLLPSSNPPFCNETYLEERVGSKTHRERRKNKKWFQKVLCLKAKFKKGRQIKRQDRCCFLWKGRRLFGSWWRRGGIPPSSDPFHLGFQVSSSETQRSCRGQPAHQKGHRAANVSAIQRPLTEIRMQERCNLSVIL